MSWRTVIVSQRCKLDYRMGYMVLRTDEIKQIFLDEIAILVVENTAVSLTGSLLAALTEKKIKVIFCDEKHNPHSELMPYYGSYDTSLRVKKQAAWKAETKALVWQRIQQEKIWKQSVHLKDLGCYREQALLVSYIPDVMPGDVTNREGFAAKVYFNALFGMDFTRGKECPVNAALNYGYSILLSAMNREIIAEGCITQLGIFHENQFNQFNLSSDLMEPFRPLVDRKVVEMMPETFDNSCKHTLWALMNDEVVIADTHQTVLNAMRIYTRSVLRALDEDAPDEIRFYKMS